MCCGLLKLLTMGMAKNVLRLLALSCSCRSEHANRKNCKSKDLPKAVHCRPFIPWRARTSKDETTPQRRACDRPGPVREGTPSVPRFPARFPPRHISRNHAPSARWSRWFQLQATADSRSAHCHGERLGFAKRFIDARRQPGIFFGKRFADADQVHD